MQKTPGLIKHYLGHSKTNLTTAKDSINRKQQCKKILCYMCKLQQMKQPGLGAFLPYTQARKRSSHARGRWNMSSEGHRYVPEGEPSDGPRVVTCWGCIRLLLCVQSFALTLLFAPSPLLCPPAILANRAVTNGSIFAGKTRPLLTYRRWRLFWHILVLNSCIRPISTWPIAFARFQSILRTVFLDDTCPGRVM